MKILILFQRVITTAAIIFLAACESNSPESTPGSEGQPQPIIFYNWVDYMPQSILDDFQAEYGIPIHYLTYNSQEEALKNIQTGMAFDVAIVEGDSILNLATGGWLADIDLNTISNFKNISDNFRELSFDPGNRYSVPFNWGTLGLIVRPQLTPVKPMHWNDLWNSSIKDRVCIRSQPKELIAIALKSLGYSISSENPAELAAAQERLVELKGKAKLLEPTTTDAITSFFNYECAVMAGWPADVITAQAKDKSIEFILPNEGAMIWIETFVVSAHSPRQYQAMLFINYLLRPKVAAAFANQYYYATTNEAAKAFIDTAITQNPVVFPPIEQLARAEWWAPLTPAGSALWEATWQGFLDAR